jgi:hypothetical protein
MKKPKQFDIFMEEIRGNVEKIHRFKTNYFSDWAFRDYINRELESTFQNHEEVWLAGYFTNGSARLLGPLLRKYPNCKVRVFSHGFKKDNRGRQNREALERLQEDGAEVGISDYLHFRTLIAYNEATDTMHAIIGSFDYTPEVIGANQYNAGIITNDPDIIHDLRLAFLHVWRWARSLDEYTQL